MMHIAVIDDSPTALNYMALALRKLGIKQITTTTNAVEALQWIKNDPNKYSVVITDLNMPVMDGMELVKELGMLQYPGSIIISSEMDGRIVQLAYDVAKHHKANLAGKIPKPYSLKDVSLALEKVNRFNNSSRTKLKVLTRDELIKAISKRDVIPYFQPKLNTITNQVDSVEVLARIKGNDSKQPILPGSFIQTAEKYDLIDMLTLQIIEATAERFPTLKAIFGNQIKLSFNLSPTQLDNYHCPKQLSDVLEYYKIPASQVILEITEEQALQTATQLESLNRLRIKGYGASMDDFGTGFTSLQQLLHLPFTELKIDRSLISNIQQDHFSQTVVQSIANITKQMNITLVAEGIEQQPEYDYLKHHYEGIILQGFLISRPEPLEALEFWYNNWREKLSYGRVADSNLKQTVNS